VLYPAVTHFYARLVCKLLLGSVIKM